MTLPGSDSFSRDSKWLPGSVIPGSLMSLFETKKTHREVNRCLCHLTFSHAVSGLLPNLFPQLSFFVAEFSIGNLVSHFLRASSSFF